jgi:hypothetical protein
MKKTMKRVGGGYKLAAGSLITITLPNGMDAELYASNSGEYVTIGVRSHDQGLNPMLKLRDTGLTTYKGYQVESIGISGVTEDRKGRLSVGVESYHTFEEV